MGTWQLFIDESGRYDVENQPVLLAGWLVRAYDSVAFRGALRDAIGKATAPMPWAPHSAHAASAAFHVALAARRAAGGSCVAADRRALMSARAWPGWQQREWETLLNEYTIDIRDLRRMEQWLEANHRPTADWARAARDRHGLAIRAVLGAIDATVHTAKLDSCVVGAYDDGRGAHGPDRARFAHALRTLLERVRQLVAAPGRPQDLWVHVAARGFADGSRLTNREVVDAIAAVVAPWDDQDRWPLTVRLHSVAPFDRNAHPGLVVADYVANRLRGRAIRGEDWNAIARRASSWVGLAIESTPRLDPCSVALPSIAAVDAPADVLRAHFQAPFDPAPEVVLAGWSPAWERAQALAWCGLADRLRTSGILP